MKSSSDDPKDDQPSIAETLQSLSRAQEYIRERRRNEGSFYFEVVPPHGIPKLNPDKPPDAKKAAGCGDFLLMPVASQFLHDSTLMLIEISRRERLKNYDKIKLWQAEKTRNNDDILQEFDGVERTELYQTHKHDDTTLAERAG
eukprot:CAMPEP_0169210300 /NCGR_PEP_ID=MMETSP1016-20121227/15138_1 /TAXON_ID=342587 /ORGANISM="Karlodinium micrum, Strain CCMP2283" /LENGTH=143 /DNA_ID=CAMNT_0009287825 /DNA_START=57 /DNA_END=484 /DNA_ORIENTATION=+